LITFTRRKRGLPSRCAFVFSKKSHCQRKMKMEMERLKTEVENTIRNVKKPLQDESLVIEKSWMMMINHTD